MGYCLVVRGCGELRAGDGVLFGGEGMWGAEGWGWGIVWW